MTNAPTIELLHALLGDPHQKTVMPVRIVGMPLKMGTNRLNPGICVLDSSIQLRLSKERSRGRGSALNCADS